MGKSARARFHVECHPDERLLRTLGVPRKEIKHWRDKGRVCKHVQKTNGVLGLIDEDPAKTQPSLFKHIRPNFYPRYGLKVYDIETSRLIVLCPRLEEWIVQAAKEAGVKMAHFGLPENGDDLHDKVLQRLESFGQLVEELQKRGSPHLQQLKRLLNI